MSKTVRQTRNVLLCWHVGKGTRSHGVLEISTHVARAAMCVLSVEEVVYGYGILTIHGRIFLSVMLHIAFFDVV